MAVQPFLDGRKAVKATSRRSVGQNSLPGIGTCTECNLLELIKRDEKVNIVQLVAVLKIQSTDEPWMFREPSPDDRVIHLLPAGALDDEPDGDVIAGKPHQSPMVPIV